MHHQKAFTLIELLIVIAVIAIISVVIVLVLNPAELLRESRDSNRLSDMASMADAFNVYAGEGGTSYGSANTVYVSIPDPAATSTAGDQCQGLALLPLPAAYGYHCAASSTYRAIDGTGWIPVNFNAVSSRSPLGHLPIDPVNSSSSRLYYTYTTNGTQYEMTSVIESQKYGLGASNDVISGDGGTLASVYERGTQLGLEPLDYGDSSLVGYWTLDEGTGTVAYDYSGNNATGSWNGSQAGTSGYYSAGRGGGYSWAGAYDGSTDYVQLSTGAITPAVNSRYTVSMWVNIGTGTGVLWGPKNANDARLFGPVWCSAGIICAVEENVSTIGGSAIPYTPGQWSLIAYTYDGTTLRDYSDGLLEGTANYVYHSPYSGAYTIDSPASGQNTLIDDVRVYNRALSAAQIAAMYNGGK